jgi:hypothetical protein
MRLSDQWFLVALIGVAVTAYGCATRPVAPPPSVAAPVCVVAAPVYTLAQEQELAAEVAKLDPNSMLFTVVADYGRVRKATGVCAGR